MKNVYRKDIILPGMTAGTGYEISLSYRPDTKGYSLFIARYSEDPINKDRTTRIGDNSTTHGTLLRVTRKLHASRELRLTMALDVKATELAAAFHEGGNESLRPIFAAVAAEVANIPTV